VRVAEEKNSLEELEVLLKQQELKLKELEVRAKGREVASSKWLNPVVIGLFSAALVLLGNVIVTTINSSNTQALERARTQSTIIFEAIKTNGDTNAACKNLIFFASLGLIEDTNHAITGACPGNMQGIPSVSVHLPADALSGTIFYPVVVRTVDDRGAPVSDVDIEGNVVPSNPPLQVPVGWEKEVESDDAYGWLFRGTISRCKSGDDGTCFLGKAPAGRFIAILAKKDGYAGSRTNTFFMGTSVVIVLKKS
jgi:hypothetical protein